MRLTFDPAQRWLVGGACRFTIRLLVIASTLAAALPALAQSEASAVLRSPYRLLTRTQKLVDTLALRLILGRDYVEHTAADRPWRTAEAKGVRAARFFARPADGGTERTLEVAIADYPQGGYEIHLFGLESGAEGAAAPNPDLAGIEGSVADLIATIEAEQADTSRPPEVAYQIYPLSYIQSDRAIAILKSLGYTTIEFRAEAGDMRTDQIFTPDPSDNRLPVIVKLIDSAKTSMLDESPLLQPQPITELTTETLPDLGGLYLHGVTSGEPPQRLMIIHDPDDPEALERLLLVLHEQIDVAAQQILIEALIIELASDRLRDLGLAVETDAVKGVGAGTRRRIGAGFGEPKPLPIDPDADTVAPLPFFDPFTFTFERLALLDTFGFRATLKAMVDRGEAEILSNPSVLVLDGRQARIQIGENRPVVETTATNFATQETVRYFPVGIVLNLRPRIADQGAEVVMQVETIVSSVALTGTTDSILTAPIVDNRQVQTFVRIANDTPFIIGGLISTEKSDQVTGVPILSDIPILGAFFRRSIRQSAKKEVIVVLTPHVVPAKTKNFSYVIPQETSIFDSFQHDLFRNAYRVRDQDVYDLRFLQQSRFYQDLVEEVRAAADGDPVLKKQPAIAAVLAGSVPGEEVLVRRMLWEIIGRQQVTKHIGLPNIIYFESAPDAPDGSGARLAFLNRTLPERFGASDDGVVLSYPTDLAGTPEHPFVQPRANVSYIPVTGPRFVATLQESNQRRADGEAERWSVVLADGYDGVSAAPIEALKRVLILKRVLDLNPNLALTLKEFYPGRQIIFPTEVDLEQRFHLVDPMAAKLFYETLLYYPAFELEFMRQSRSLKKLLDGNQAE